MWCLSVLGLGVRDVQGQNYVVDVMMKAGLPERETFCLFLYLLRQGHLHGIYRKEVMFLREEIISYIR